VEDFRIKATPTKENSFSIFPQKKDFTLLVE